MSLGLLISACGSSVPEEELPATIAETVCNQQADCECPNALAVDQCKTLVESAYKKYLTSPSPELVYDAGCAGQSVDQISDLGCGAVKDLVETTECNVCKIYHGDKKVGEACQDYEDSLYDNCDQGLVCADKKCVDFCSPAGEGEECLSRPCIEGYVCVLSLDSGTSSCEVAAGLGESCENTSCVTDLMCDFDTSTCVERPALGEHCQGSCQDGSYCDASSDNVDDWVCVAPKADGEACEGDSECESLDCDHETDKCTTRALICTFLDG